MTRVDATECLILERFQQVVESWLEMRAALHASILRKKILVEQGTEFQTCDTAHNSATDSAYDCTGGACRRACEAHQGGAYTGPLYCPFCTASETADGTCDSPNGTSDLLAIVAALDVRGLTCWTVWNHINHLMQSRLSRPVG